MIVEAMWITKAEWRDHVRRSQAHLPRCQSRYYMTALDDGKEEVRRKRMCRGIEDDMVGDFQDEFGIEVDNYTIANCGAIDYTSTEEETRNSLQEDLDRLEREAGKVVIGEGKDRLPSWTTTYGDTTKVPAERKLVTFATLRVGWEQRDGPMLGHLTIKELMKALMYPALNWQGLRDEDATSGSALPVAQCALVIAKIHNTIRRRRGEPQVNQTEVLGRLAEKAQLGMAWPNNQDYVAWRTAKRRRSFTCWCKSCSLAPK